MQPVLVLWVGLFVIYMIISGGASTVLKNVSTVTGSK